MKILCFIDSIGSGGAQRQLVELALGFKEKGHQVEFLVYHHEPFFLPQLEEQSISYQLIEEGNFLKRIIKIRRYIRNSNYDAVISFLEGPNFISELSTIPNKKWKLIVGERSSNPKILISTKLRIFRWLHFFADYVVSNSHENKKIVKKANPLLSGKKQKVIYNIVNENKWNFKAEPRPIIKDKFKLIVVASHQYLKNGKGLVNAVNLLNQETKNKLKIDWYGDISPDQSFKELSVLISEKGLGKIFEFHNATNEIADKVIKSDALGLFSLYEGLPNVICEAMTLGKPIIASRVSDIPILLNNSNRCLFDPNNPIEIAKSIEYIVHLNEDELSFIGKENKIRGLDLFDKETILTNYLNLMQ